MAQLPLGWFRCAESGGVRNGFWKVLHGDWDPQCPLLREGRGESME